MSLAALRQALKHRSPAYRRPCWRALEPPLDLLVVGGGIHGAGIARDATYRGLRVALVEKQDWGSGTSSRSSKLFHGGLRYLEHGEFSLVRNGLKERNRHLRLMPKLVHSLRFQVTLPHASFRTRLKFRLGVALYDVLTLGSTQARFWGAVPSYNDAVTDDARFVWELVRDARDQGALGFNYCEWLEWTRGPAGNVTGALIRDRLTEQLCTVRATACVNAAGPWTGDLQSDAKIRLTRGVHVVLKGQPEDGEARLFLSPGDGRVLFVIPYLEGCSLVGTTDVDTREPDADPVPSGGEMTYLHRAFHATFPAWRGWKPVGWLCGLRPLVEEEGAPSRVSREEVVLAHPKGGLWSVLGGKYTGYRSVAQQVVDRITASKASPSRGTAAIPLAPRPTPKDPLRAAFQGEDSVLLEDALFRRTFQAHSGGATRECVLRAGECFADHWELAPSEGGDAAREFLDQLQIRHRVLDLWA